MKNLQILSLNLALMLIYIIAGKLGLAFASVNPSATVVWAPTGIALASILLFGFRVAPAIFLGAFIVNSTTAGTLATSLGIATGNLLEALIGAYFVKKFTNGNHAFDRVADILKFTFFAGILSTTVSANIGVATLLLGKLASWETFWPVWMTWWLGDMGGNLIIAPFILAWTRHLKMTISYRKMLHFALLLFLLFCFTQIIFSGIVPYPYLYIPLAVWIAFWFRQKGGTIAIITIGALIIYYTLKGFGPFAQLSANQSLIQLQLFLNVFSLTTLIFAAAVLEIRRNEKNLAIQQQRFRALIEKSFDAVVLIDPTSRILYASPTFKQIMGYTPKEIEGTIGFNLIAREDLTRVMNTLAKLVLKPGSIVTTEYRAIRKDKKTIWVQATGTNLLLDPDINAVVVNFRDITEEKILEETMLAEKMEDEAMLSSIGEGIIATDNKGRITLVNHAACEILGWAKDELIDKSLAHVIPMEDEHGSVLPHTERPITKVLSLGKKIVSSKTNYYVRKDKTKIPVHCTVTPIMLDKKLVGTIEVFGDITREKEIDRIKDEFIAMTSHELRTPMTAIKGLLSMIFHGDYGHINEQLMKPLHNIQISAERQIHLINDLLNVSRLQTGKIDLKLHNFSIGDSLEEIVKILTPLAIQKKLIFTSKSKQDILIQADIEWTKHILNNLIANAIKFTDKGSITLSCKDSHDRVLIAISDTGAGIGASDQKKLFGRFQQLSNPPSANPGSGLGLYLSRELARKMGGDIVLDRSLPGQGSTFVLSLPKADTALAKQVKKQLTSGKLHSSPKENIMEELLS